MGNDIMAENEFKINGQCSICYEETKVFLIILSNNSKGKMPLVEVNPDFINSRIKITENEIMPLCEECCYEFNTRVEKIYRKFKEEKSPLESEFV